MDKVRIAVVGCGGMGQAHAKWIKELAEAQLTAIVDSDAETAQMVGTEHQVPFFTNHEELLKSGLADAVVIATPHYFHHEIGIAAFEAGLHVLSEKPLTITVATADAFLAAAHRSNRVFGVMYQMRTLPAIRVASQILKEGRLGKLQRTLMVDPCYRTQAYYQSAGWRGTWIGEGGGVLLNQAPHGIDLFLHLGGLPNRITSRTRTKMHQIEVEDEADALLEYPNGAWGYYYTTVCEVSSGPYLEVVGDKGKIVWQSGNLRFYTFQPAISEHCATSTEMWSAPEMKEEPLTIPEAPSGHKEIIKNFCRAILFGEELLSPGEDGLKSVEFINALILSGKKKKPVPIPVDRLEYDQLLQELKKTSQPKKTGTAKRETDPHHR